MSSRLCSAGGLNKMSRKQSVKSLKPHSASQAEDRNLAVVGFVWGFFGFQGTSCETF